MGCSGLGWTFPPRTTTLNQTEEREVRIREGQTGLWGGGGGRITDQSEGAVAFQGRGCLRVLVREEKSQLVRERTGVQVCEGIVLVEVKEREV